MLTMAPSYSKGVTLSSAVTEASCVTLNLKSTFSGEVDSPLIRIPITGAA